LAQLLAPVDGDRGDAEARGVGERVAGIAERGDEIVEMTALDDAEAGAAEQDQDGRGDADPARKITLERQDETIGRFAVDHRPGPYLTTTEILAQQHDRSNSGCFQISLGPQRSQRSG